MKSIHLVSLLLLGVLVLPAHGQETESSSTQENPPAQAKASQEEVKDVQYVTDKLRLSLYKQASASSGTKKLLVSGDRLEVLERKGPYSRVRTSDGLVGWVKNGFLISEATAVTQLAEARKRIAQLESDLDKYANSRATLQQYEKRIAQLEEDKARAEQALENANQRIAELEQQLEQVQAELQRSQEGAIGWSELLTLAQLYWWLLVAISLLLALLGFLLGKLWIESRIRSRFHGYKVW